MLAMNKNSNETTGNRKETLLWSQKSHGLKHKHKTAERDISNCLLSQPGLLYDGKLWALTFCQGKTIGHCFDATQSAECVCVCVYIYLCVGFCVNEREIER